MATQSPTSFYIQPKSPKLAQFPRFFSNGSGSHSQSTRLQSNPFFLDEKYQTSNLNNNKIKASHSTKPQNRENNISNFQNQDGKLLRLDNNSNNMLPIAIPPQRRVEYVPYQQRYVEYVQQRVKVPVHKKMTDYYKIEHIIDYIPIEKQDIVYVTQPKETVNMKLQYIPVQQRIVHVRQDDAQMIQMQEAKINQQYSHQGHLPVTFQQYAKVNAKPTNEISQSYIQKSKTNFVTSQSYDPSQTLKQIDRVLASSAVRQNMTKNLYYDPIGYPQHNSNFYGAEISGNLADGIANLIKQPNFYDQRNKNLSFQQKR